MIEPIPDLIDPERLPPTHDRAAPRPTTSTDHLAPERPSAGYRVAREEIVLRFAPDTDWLSIGFRIGVGVALASSLLALFDLLIWWAWLSHELKWTFAGTPLN